jgi:hypothetical protein
MEDLNLLLNHTYLLRYGYQDSLYSVTVLMITDKAYKVRWNGSGSETWELKRLLYGNYSLVEDISDFVAPKPEDFKFEIQYKDVDVKLRPYFLQTENCKVCGGSGQVQCFETTAGTKTCPACNGSGKESKRIDILFE